MVYLQTIGGRVYERHTREQLLVAIATTPDLVTIQYGDQTMYFQCVRDS
jgi:hypothetical protein